MKQLDADDRAEQLSALGFAERLDADGRAEQLNVSFQEGYIEDLATAGVADKSVDVVVSNCVVNLSPNKPKTLQEIFRALKEGAEFYLSDVYASHRVPPELK